jgi:hypothetical protein
VPHPRVWPNMTHTHTHTHTQEGRVEVVGLCMGGVVWKVAHCLNGWLLDDAVEQDD